MLALTKKQMLVLLVVLLSICAVLAVSMAVIHATNLSMWHHLIGWVPDVWSHY